MWSQLITRLVCVLLFFLFLVPPAKLPTDEERTGCEGDAAIGPGKVTPIT